MNSGGISNFIKGIGQLFLDFIGYLFDLDFREKETENPFSNLPNSTNLKNKNRVFATSEDEELLETAFGEEAANYINNLRNEVDYLVQEHGLKKTNSILTVIPPERLAESNNFAITITGMIENIYSQFDGDVILRPGIVNVFENNNGVRFAEMYIDCYQPVEMLVKN